MKKTVYKPFIAGLLAALILLLIYFLTSILISGPSFAKKQFIDFWYFILALAIGFGIQVGLYFFLRSKIQDRNSTKVVAASGGVSTVSMISCCSHYLVNILPIIGVTGLISIVARYQKEIFLLAIASNIAGTLFILSRIRKAHI